MSSRLPTDHVVDVVIGDVGDADLRLKRVDDVIETADAGVARRQRLVLWQRTQRRGATCSDVKRRDVTCSDE